MTEQAKTQKKPTDITVGRAKGRPMLSWVGKKPLGRVGVFPAQQVERFTADDSSNPLPKNATDWSEWPNELPQGGLLYHGDNKEVLANLLANGFRGKIKLIYIDPPFDSGADYVRKVQLRGPKGKLTIEGEDYALGEQIQYTDIWSNDNYLQFMYERLLMLRELLTEDGSLYLHCDWHKVHLLRCMCDEIFGSGAADGDDTHAGFRNEVVWCYAGGATPTKAMPRKHDNLLWYSKSDKWTFNPQYRAYSEGTMQRGRTAVKGEDAELRSEGTPINDWWTDVKKITSPTDLEKRYYPTQKSDELVGRIIDMHTNENDIVLDCFVGSGTTAAAAQIRGRRWICCDINKGSIQTTAKLLHDLIREQANDVILRQKGISKADDHKRFGACQFGFSTYRVNDYDLHIQHNEAVELACEHLGITRTRTDPFFDGTRGKMLVKIIPLNHPLSPLDLEALRTELKNRPEEERDLLVVSLGQEHKAREWLDHYNNNRPINKIHSIELRTDRKAGGFIKHEPMSVQASAQREGNKLIVTIADVVSPSIIARLDLQEGIFRAQIPDWRAVVDCILIDADHDGAVFNVTLADVPERKQDLVAGRYELVAPPVGSVVAVKVIDMLGEERIVSLAA